jgi:hypothetical protein
MVNEPLGLQTTWVTWTIALALGAGWVATLPLIVRVRSGWAATFTSLAGLTWLAFGLGILFRFLILSYDSVAFGDRSTRLLERAPEIVDYTLINAGVYWASFVAAVLLVRVVPITRPISLLNGFERIASANAIPVVVLGFSASVVLALVGSTPAALVTPLSLLGTMWVVPATMVWLRHFSGSPQSPLILGLVLVPGLTRAVMSPYREHVLLLLLVPIFGAMFAGKRIPLRIAAPWALALALGSTILIGAYRQFLWFDLPASDVLDRISLAEWIEEPYDAPWTENIRRFHVFDSLLLTVDLIPDALPYSGRNVLLEGVTRGLIPRLLDPQKGQSDAGQRFQMLFWMFDANPEAELATAAIAPSMPGSLFEAAGMVFVASGAFLWGLLVAGIDRAARNLSTPVAAGLHALCSLQALAGLERDYTMAFSTLLQTLLVFGVCAVVAARVLRPVPRFSTARVADV